MRKILSIFAAALVAVAVNAEPVVLPATLDVNNVSFRSEGMPDFVLAEGDYAGTYFDMGAHDSSNDTTLYAEWNVTIQPLKYNITVGVYNENSWSVRFHVLNQANEEVKTMYYKGHSGEKGKYAAGTIDMRDLAAGDYKIRVHAATAWSKLKVKEVIMEADYQGVTVALPGTLLPAYAELSANASVTDGAIAFKPSTANEEYATWNVSFAAAGSYNVSIDFTASNGHTYGVALLSADGTSEIGAVAEAQSWDTGVKELGAIAVPAAGSYKVKLTNATQWSEAVLNSITFAAPAEPLQLYLRLSSDWAGWPARYAIYTWKEGTGDLWAPMAAVEGETNLYTASIPSDNDKLIFVRLNGETSGYSWEEKWSQSVDLTLPTDGNNLYTITAGGTGSECTGVWSVYGTPYVPEHADGYYLVGKFGGVEQWGVAEERMMTLNGEAGHEEYMITVTLAEGDELKVVKSENDQLTWFPNEQGNYVVDANHAGEKTIYFRPDGLGDEAFYAGVIYVAPNSTTALENVDAAVKTVKMIENGQLFIIKNGVKYNAIGTVVK